MALDIQAPNLSGLASLAGHSAPLNIAPTGALGLQAFQQRSANEASLREDAIRRAQLQQQQQQMQQQGQLALGQQSIQRQAMEQQGAQQDRQGLLAERQMGMDKQKLAMLGGQFQDEMAFKQQQLGQVGDIAKTNAEIDKQKLFQEHQQEAMKKLLDENKETINAKGAHASYGLMALRGAKSPEEAQQISNEFIKEALSKKYVTEEEAKMFSQMPLSMRQNVLTAKIIEFGKANEFKAAQPEKEKDSTGGTSEVILPDGTVVKSSSPTKAVTGDVQKKIMGAENNLKELDYMLKNVPDHYFGLEAFGQTGNYLRELGQIIPGVEPSKEDKADFKRYSEMEGQVKNLSMNIIKDLSGLSYTDKQLEFMNDIVPQIGKLATRSQFEGRAENLRRFFSQVKKYNQDILKDGIITEGSEAHKEALLDKMRSAPIGKPSLREHLESLNFSKEKIDAALKARGLE